MSLLWMSLREGLNCASGSVTAQRLLLLLGATFKRSTVPTIRHVPYGPPRPRCWPERRCSHDAHDVPAPADTTPTRHAVAWATDSAPAPARLWQCPWRRLLARPHPGEDRRQSDAAAGHAPLDESGRDLSGSRETRRENACAAGRYHDARTGSAAERTAGD